MGEKKKSNLKKLTFIADVNRLMNDLVILHKSIPDNVTSSLIDIKLKAMDYMVKLDKFRESLNTINADNEELRDKVLINKWKEEINKEVEFEIPLLRKTDIQTLLIANKEIGLTGSQIAFIYEIFQVTD